MGADTEKEPLDWQEHIWCGLPLILILLGGLLGGVCGLPAWGANIWIFRSPLPRPVRFFVSALVSAASVILYFVLFFVLNGLTAPDGSVDI